LAHSTTRLLDTHCHGFLIKLVCQAPCHDPERYCEGDGGSRPGSTGRQWLTGGGRWTQKPERVTSGHDRVREVGAVSPI